MKVTLLFIFFPISLLAQKFELEKNDTLYLDSFKYPTYMLKIGNSSASDPAKVFVTKIKYVNTLRQLIPKYYFTRKQEYNEYYILGVPELSQTKDVEFALTAYLNQIDSSRMVRKRSTFLRVCSWDNVKYEINYEQTFKNLSKVDNVFYIKKVQDICRYMICPGKRQIAD
jgi:hypothetical protein